MERRKFLAGALGAGLMAVGSKAAAQAMCSKTPAQPEGPFYPGEGQFQATNDLTWAVSPDLPALGERIHIVGQVQDQLCQPVPGVNVEIWQACASGRYNNDRDPNPAPLDPNFRYWGETFSDESGMFEFWSIKPGAYPAAEDWDRPPHIHFRVAKRGYEELITQLYFAGESLNEFDKILSRIPRDARDRVVVNFRQLPFGGGLRGRFDITLNKL